MRRVGVIGVVGEHLRSELPSRLAVEIVGSYRLIVPQRFDRSSVSRVRLIYGAERDRR